LFQLGRPDMAKRRTTSLDILHQRPGALTDLEEDFRESGNPVCPWLAMQYTLRNGSKLPKWAEDYFAQTANGVEAIVEEARAKKAMGRVADRIATLMGFGNDDDGQSRWFAHTALRERDWRLHDAVVTEIVWKGAVRKNAYGDVAKAHGVSPATVGKAFARMEGDVQEDDTTD
jgi:hypothetical protein